MRLGAVEVGDVVAVHDGLAARRADLVDDLLRRRAVGARAVGRRAEVVHDDLRAVVGEHERVFAPDAAPRAGDDAHPVPAEIADHPRILPADDGVAD